MATSTVKERVYTMVKEHLGTNAEMHDDAKLIDDLGADSLDQVELVMAAEEEFKVVISDEDAEKVVTLGDMVRVVEESGAV